MKNIYLIETDKPSRLIYNVLGYGMVTNEFTKSDLDLIQAQYNNIYITSDEEIKEGDWVIENITANRKPYIGKCFYPKNDGTVTEEVLKRDLLSVKYEGHYETLARKHSCKKIILTTDPDLIKDGVQAIDDEFLKWFVKNPSCESVEFKNYKSSEYPLNYKIIIPQEEPKQREMFLMNAHTIIDTRKTKENLENFPFDELVKKFDEYFKKAPFKEEPKKDFYKIGNFHERCDDSCKYHCTKGNTQMAECLECHFNNTSKEQIENDWKEAGKQTEGINSPTVEEFLEAQTQFKKQETLEEVAKNYASKKLQRPLTIYYPLESNVAEYVGFINGAKFQSEKMYSEEEVIELLQKYRYDLSSGKTANIGDTTKIWFEQFKKK
jgi:hypothetical protein